MYYLYTTLVPKVKHRSQIKTSIFLHESTVTKANFQNKKILKDLIILEQLDINALTTLKLENPIRYAQYLKNQTFWDNFFKTLPRRKLDNAILRGTYLFIANLKIQVRSNKRHTNQLIELIYE